MIALVKDREPRPSLVNPAAAKAGTPTAWGPKHAHEGYSDTVNALLDHPAYSAPLGKNQGRGVASGFWFNNGGESSAAVHVNEDGTVVVATGSMDIGGSRASMAMMAAETLGIEQKAASIRYIRALRRLKEVLAQMPDLAKEARHG